MGRIAVFAPHQDDETLNCGGLIAKAVRNGDQVHIVYSTNGNASHSANFKISEKPTPEELANERKKEVFRATGILGVDPSDIVFLDFPDGRLDEYTREFGTAIYEILREIEPVEIILPSNLDLHPDHKVTHQAVMWAKRFLPAQVDVLEYRTWVNAHLGKESRLAQTPATIADASNIVRVDISDVLHLKRAAIEQYQSQIALRWQSQKEPVLSEEFLRPFMENRCECFVVG